MPREVGADTRSGTTGDASAWLSSWRTRMWARWRLQIGVEASLWAVTAALLVFVPTHHALAAAAAGMVVGLWRAVGGGLVHDVRAMLRAVEAGRPDLQNALVAWHETSTGRLAVAPAFEARLFRQARSALNDAPTPHPRTRRDWWLALAAVALATGVAWLIPASERATSTTGHTGRDVAAPGSAALGSVGASFLIRPPAYTGRAAIDLGSIDLVDVLVGSTVEATFTAMPDGGSVRLGDDTLKWTRADETHLATFTAVRSGLLTVQDSAGGAVHTTAIQVTPDATPVVRITSPGQDLRVADAARVIPVTVTASDDIGVRNLRLLYTRVTGGGESFDFIDGELPLAVRRVSETSWQGSASLDLTALEMGQGDTLVYFAVARDGRPDAAGLAESERFLVEMPRPGDLAGGDFSLPEPEQRYAVSQRMVILLTERLLQQRTRMAPADYLREAQSLAIQQRRVRAEFVFLMGGDVVDEVEEAEHSHEIEAGRLDNSGQQELLEAVRQMARAEQRLTDGDLGAALPYEYRALNALQAAFGKARYFMRTLPTTVAIDLDRRGSGSLDLVDPAPWQRVPFEPDDVGRARESLLRLMALTSASDVTAVTAVTDGLISIDAGTTAWLQVVRDLVSTFAHAPLANDRQRALDTVADALRARLLASSPATLPLALPRGQQEGDLARTPGASR